MTACLFVLVLLFGALAAGLLAMVWWLVGLRSCPLCGGSPET